MANSTISNNFTTEATPALETTADSTSVAGPDDGNGGGGMSGGSMAGMIIGIIAGIVVIGGVVFLVLRKYRKMQKEKNKGYKEYKDKVNQLKIDQLPSPSDIEGAEIRPRDRKPIKKEEPVDDTSGQFYENEDDKKMYENVNNDKQPIYLEPAKTDTLTYTAANVAHGEAEYYVVEERGKSPPGLPSRDEGHPSRDESQPSQDDKVDSQSTNLALKENVPAQVKQHKTHQKHQNARAESNVTKPKNFKTKADKKGPPKPRSGNHVSKAEHTPVKSKQSESASDSDSESNGLNKTAKDYVNLKDQPLTPPPGKGKRPKTTPQPMLTPPTQDDVYENEEIPKSPRARTTKR